MTNSPIKGVNPLLSFVSAKPTGSAMDNLTNNFSETFSKASGQQNMSLQNDNMVQGSSQVKVNHTDRKGLDTNASADTGNKAEKTQDIKTDKRTQDELQKAGEELTGKVAEELGVSEEAVKNAMEMLGLTMVDLLDADNMTQLVLTLEDADMLSLMTDEGLYNSLQNLLGMVNEALNVIQEDLGISQEELAALLEETETEEEQPQEIVKDDTAQIPDGQEDYSVTVERDGEVVRVSVEVDGNNKTESAEVTTQKVQVPEEKVVDTSNKEEGTKKDNSSQKHHTEGNLFAENLLKADNAVKTDALFESQMAESTTGMTSTQDIMDQIMDYMKVQVKADLTQMQLQLHPASLGTVNINIASKEGVITAQFLTQNEAVKAAIESQIVQLKNSFEEQGIKVEAVEVTVESHQFERNLNRDGNGQQQSQEGKKKSTRRINLNELSLEEETEMDEEQQIAVAMMNAGGNTVDYTA